MLAQTTSTAFIVCQECGKKIKLDNANPRIAELSSEDAKKIIKRIESYTWQPIDSAPKDGCPILAWKKAWLLPRWVHYVFNPRTGTTFWNDAYEWDHYELENEPPTHWINIKRTP